MVNNYIITPTTRRYAVSANRTQHSTCSVDCRSMLMMSHRGCKSIDCSWCHWDNGNLVFIILSPTSNSVHTSFSRPCYDHVTPVRCSWSWSSQISHLNLNILNVYVDSSISMRSHVAKTSSNCFAVLRRTSSIRRSFTLKFFGTTRLVNAVRISIALRRVWPALAGSMYRPIYNYWTVHAITCIFQSFVILW